MKYLKKFESEIWNGSRSHYNAIKPVNQQIFEPKKIYSFHCSNCNFDFATEESDQNYCSICLSEDISKTND